MPTLRIFCAFIQVSLWWSWTTPSSCLNSGIEEFVYVNDILEEAPFGATVYFGIEIGVNGGVNLLSHSNSLLELSGLGLSHKSNQCNCGVFEHENLL